jgi:hypothetical protein
MAYGESTRETPSTPDVRMFRRVTGTRVRDDRTWIREGEYPQDDDNAEREVILDVAKQSIDEK